jgi:hypothetical protein
VATMQRNQACMNPYTEEDKKLIQSGDNYANMTPIRDETPKEKAFKGYKPAQFTEG